MKFAEIIKNAGLEPAQFPKSSIIDISLYDGKDRIDENKTVSYAKPLFEEYPSSLKAFERYLSGIEKTSITSMLVKIDEMSVILLYKTPSPVVFLRKFMDPMDYMN